jgi:hypothetical protein
MVDHEAAEALEVGEEGFVEVFGDFGAEEA